MNSKQSANDERGDAKGPSREEFEAWEPGTFTPEQIKVFEEVADDLNKALPWLSATRQEARVTAVRAWFPRSRFGDKQDARLLRAIYCVIQRRANAADFHEIVDAAARCCQSPEDQPYFSQLEGAPKGTWFWIALELFKLLMPGEPFLPKTESEFFSRIAEALKHFETYKPTTGDFAVEALQNAFVGLTQSKYAWGKKGLPTKGEVIAMAKEHLERDGKSKGSGWTEMLEKAGLKWLPKGKAGRPTKQEVDENVKAEREYKALCTRAIRDFYNGDPQSARDVLKAAYGNRAEYRRSENDRLRGVSPGSEQGLE